MSHGWGEGEVPKKCHILFEWPHNKILYSFLVCTRFRDYKPGDDSADVVTGVVPERKLALLTSPCVSGTKNLDCFEIENNDLQIFTTV